MAKKLKVFQRSLGFFDLAIAAPSMKAALEPWGADTNLFHQGVACERRDPDIVTATMEKPGVVLRRPVGSDGPFGEHAELPTRLDGTRVELPGTAALTEPDHLPVPSWVDRTAGMGGKRTSGYWSHR